MVMDGTLKAALLKSIQDAIAEEAAAVTMYQQLAKDADAIGHVNAWATLRQIAREEYYHKVELTAIAEKLRSS
jgi:rubrerythrin